MRFSRRSCRLTVWLLMVLAASQAIALPLKGRIARALVPVTAEPNPGSEQVTQAMLWEKVEVLETKNGWSRVLVSDQFRTKRGYPGWVRSETVELAPVAPSGPWMTVAKPWVALRQEPNTEAALVGQAYFATRIPLDETQLPDTGASWLPTRLPGGKKAWVRADQVEFTPTPRVERMQQLVDQAQLFLQTPYLWGGMTRTGIDCSGFVYVLYQANAVTLPRDADQQFLVGDPVTPEELRPGDLVFFGESDDDITHVGMYVGEGEMIHASSGSGVVVSPLFQGWYKQMYRGARRILKQTGDAARVLTP